MSGNDWQASADLDTLEKRARLLQSIRAFFAAREVLELETPLLASAAVTDVHLDSMALSSGRHYLNTSPEYCMKRFIAEHGRDVYQVCKSFRHGEAGHWHNPEFSMLEWYRVGFSMQQLIDEVSDMLRYVSTKLGENEPLIDAVSYAELFRSVTGIDPHTADVETLAAYARDHSIEVPVGLNTATVTGLQSELDLDAWLDWLMSVAVAPKLATDRYTFIYGYPASQAALASLQQLDGYTVARRFELYRGAIELANGYHELTDVAQQAARFARDNDKRALLGKPAVDIDQNFIQALQHGLPDCAGVAIGLDRLLASFLRLDGLAACMAYPWTKV